MRMLRRCLALFLALALVLGWTGTIVASGCGAPTGNAAAMLSLVPGGCGTCEDDDDKGQPQQGCAVLACTAGCVSGPATAADATPRLGRVMAFEKAAPVPQEALLARAIPPDHPPPR
jgi:hypothetical protein